MPRKKDRFLNWMLNEQLARVIPRSDETYSMRTVPSPVRTRVMQSFTSSLIPFNKWSPVDSYYILVCYLFNKIIDL